MSTSLPAGDRSSSDLRRVYSLSLMERFKRPLRRVLYPPLVAAENLFLAYRYAAATPFRVNVWIWGQRGNDYDSNRRRVNRYKSIAGADLLIVGAGTGYDAPSWLPWHPRSISGCDYFDYTAHWNEHKSVMRELSPKTRVEFAQGDAQSLGYADAAFDLYVSDAVLEHVRDLRKVVSEARRVLRPDGLFYSTWGALWYSYAGDHCSGYDGLSGGYNHLLMGAEEYKRYLDGLGPYRHDPDDGRTWVENDLFSRLRPAEYMQIIEEKFEVLFTAAIINPNGPRFMREHPSKAAQVLQVCPNGVDSLIAGMSVIAKIKT
jgi:SAM-dependent methyltransferase